MKIRSIVFTLIALGSTTTGVACPISDEEKLVCSALICNPLGIAIAESRSECLKVNAEYAIYLASLGFWDDPAQCHSRDENCNETGIASTAQMSPEYCLQAGPPEKQKTCMSALGMPPAGYCTQFDGLERTACESIQTTGQLNPEYCDAIASEIESGELGYVERQQKERELEDCLRLLEEALTLDSH